MILKKFEHKVQKFTARQIAEKLENFVKSLRNEGKDLETMELLLEKEKKDLALLAKPNENYPFDRFTITEDPRERRLQEANEPSDEEMEARILAEKETNGAKLEARINGIKDDLKAKWDNMSFAQFQVSYPMTRRMHKEQSTAFKKAHKWSGDDAWRGDWHKALIHYLECDDYNLTTPKDIEKTSHTTAQKDVKRKCGEKIELDKSIKKFVGKIPYGPYKNDVLVAPDSDDDDKSEKVKDTNEKRWKCWEENIIDQLTKLVENMGEDGVYTEPEEEDKKENRRRLMEVQRDQKLVKISEKQSMEPHPKDKELWTKIKRLARKSTRRLAVASYMAKEEESLHDLLDKTHDRHRILSLLRWHENRKQSKRSKKLRKQLDSASKSTEKTERTLLKKSAADSPAAEEKRNPMNSQQIENPKNFDNEVRLLPLEKPQPMGEANDDTIKMSDRPKALRNKAHLSKEEIRYVKDWQKHRQLPGKKWPKQSRADKANEDHEKNLAEAEKPEGDSDDDRVLVKTQVNSDGDLVKVNPRELGDDADDEEAEKSDEDKKKDDEKKEKDSKDEEKADTKDDDEADEIEKKTDDKQEKEDDKKKKSGDRRFLATADEKKENEKKEKEEKEEKAADEEKEEGDPPTENGRRLDSEANQDSETDSEPKKEAEAESTDEKKEKPTGKRRLILKHEAASDSEPTSNDYVQKYALGSRNRVLTSVSEDLGEAIGDLQTKLFQTLETIPKTLARGTKKEADYEFPENFVAKIGSKKTGYNLALLNSDRESSSVDFKRIHLKLTTLTETDLHLRFLQRSKMYGWKGAAGVLGGRSAVGGILLAMFLCLIN